jgi:TonB-dependent receptor
LRYTISDDLIARATWSTGIGRPGFNQLSADSTVDTNAMTVQAGNPDLKPTTGNNFDATLEWYLPASGIVQVGLFDKQFDNYIVTRQIIAPYQGDAGYTYVSYYNIGGAWARGLEAAYNQKFVNLPGLWSGLGTDANLTLVDSQAQLRPGDKRLLPGTSKITGNLAVFYEKGPLSLRLATEYVGKTLFGAGDGRDTDLYQNARWTADAYAGWTIDPHWSLYFKAKNLTNEKLRFYIGSNDRPVQREFYDQSYELGIKAKF